MMKNIIVVFSIIAVISFIVSLDQRTQERKFKEQQLKEEFYADLCFNYIHEVYEAYLNATAAGAMDDARRLAAAVKKCEKEYLHE